jgi:hypothetical protein
VRLDNLPTRQTRSANGFVLLVTLVLATLAISRAAGNGHVLVKGGAGWLVYGDSGSLFVRGLHQGDVAVSISHVADVGHQGSD